MKMSVCRTAIHACASFAKHLREFAAIAAVICVAEVCPHPCWGQSAVWQPQGATTGNIYYNGGNVGIGTASPSSRLEVSQGPASVSNSNYDRLQLGTPERTAAGVFGTPNGTPYAISAGTGNAVALAVGTYAAADLTFGTSNLPRMTIRDAGNVGIGTTNPCAVQAPANCKLSVAGAIQAQEVVVNTGWSDYIFHPAYRLKPLTEVAAYIAENHHLPDIPSAAEVGEKGVSLGDMQSKLLAKVEELTLHAIQAEERAVRLEQENRQLQQRVARLEARGANPQPSPAPSTTTPDRR